MPEIIAERFDDQSGQLEILALPGCPEEWLVGRNGTRVDLGNYIEVLRDLVMRGRNEIVLAGAVTRPKGKGGDPASPINLAGGDDDVLRRFLAQLEGLGMTVIGAADIVPDLVRHSGSLTERRPTEVDMADIKRAGMISGRLGSVDVGQATVVVNGVCVGIETITGTDAMLHSVAEYTSDQGQMSGRKGVLVKRSKPGQDLRVDMPVIGPGTVSLASRAGLAGIAVESGKVILIDRDEIVEMANREGMFIWSQSDLG